VLNIQLAAEKADTVKLGVICRNMKVALSGLGGEE